MRLLFLLLIIPLWGFSQGNYFNYLDSTSQWHYHTSSFDLVCTALNRYETVYFDGDTVLSGKFYYKQFRTRIDSTYNSCWGTNQVSNYTTGPEFIREDSLLRFYKYSTIDNTEYLMYDWQAFLNTSVNDPFPLNPTPSCSISLIDTTYLGAQPLQVYHGATSGLPHYVVEGVGKVMYLCGLGIEGNTILNCYQKQGDLIYMYNLNCGDFPTPTQNNTFTNYQGTLVVAEDCSSYTWSANNQAYDTTGFYTDTLVDMYGGDSIVNLYLTIYNNQIHWDNVLACGSYTWNDGITYTSSTNSPEILYTSSLGCDSIVRLNLEIGGVTYGTQYVTACQNYTWVDGNMYWFSTNQPTYTLPGANMYGCDSIITLDLTVTYPTYTEETIIACDTNAYFWNGMNYNSSGIYSVILSSSSGCDSMVTLDLTFSNSNISTDVITACDSYTWIDGINYISSNNTASINLLNINGCDSIINLDLTILNSAQYSLNTVQTTCQSGCDGSLSISPNSINQISSIEWFDLSGNLLTQDSSMSNLCSGTYVYFITDTMGCVNADTIELQAYLQPQISVDINPVTCHWECDGEAELLVSGVSGTPTIEWTNLNSVVLSQSNIVTNLCPSSFIYSLTDSLGCVYSDTINLTNPQLLENNSFEYYLGCDYPCNGNINALASGGTGNIDLIVLNDSNDTLSNYNDLCSGIYTVLAIDSLGCVEEIELNLEITDTLSVQTSVIQPSSTSGPCNGSALAQGQGGLAPYSYQWATCVGSYLAGAMAQPYALCPNDYYVIVTDALGCDVQSDCLTIEGTSGLAEGTVSSINFYPNPSNKGIVQIDCKTVIETVEIYDHLGREAETKLNIAQKTIDTSELQTGEYIVKIYSVNGNILRGKLIIL